MVGRTVNRKFSPRLTIRGVASIPGRLLAVVSVLAWLCAASGCDQSAKITEIPEIPPIDLNRFGPLIRDQIATARDQVLAQPDDAEANVRLAKILHAYRWLDPSEVLYARARFLKGII